MMKCRSITQELKTQSCPSINTPVFRECLRQILETQPKSKRERVMSLLENGCEVVVSNRIAVSGVGVSLTMVMLFIGVMAPSNDYSPIKVQAHDVVEEMEIASLDMKQTEREDLEKHLKMQLAQVINHARTSKTRAVYELDPRIPMQVVDSRRVSPKSHFVSFHQDSEGRLKATSLVKRYQTTEGSQSAFGKRRVLEIAHEDGRVMLFELSKDNLPSSVIILTTN